MKKLEIHTKGGGVIVVDCTEVEWSRNTYTNEFTSIKWTNPDGGKRRLLSLTLSEVVAFVEID